jgi:acetamidase/formamidase
VLRREFLELMAVSSEVRDGRAWFGGRIPLPLNSNLGTISTMPPEGYKPSYAGAYGGDFDQKDAGQGSRIYLQFWSMMPWSSSAIRTQPSATASSPVQASNAA